MTGRRVACFLLLNALLAAAIARADYVEVRRATVIKAEPDADSEVLARPPIGTHLTLFTRTQTPEGYYRVRIPRNLDARRATGYVHRSRVRGFIGDPPMDSGPANDDGPAKLDDLDPAAHEDDSSVPPKTKGGGTAPASSDVVYHGVPVSGPTAFPITVLDKVHFVVGYSEDMKNPVWVFYRIGPLVDMTAYPRPGFRVDTETTSRVSTSDYTNSGYARGHMAPNFALGSRFGAEGARSTFIMSNVAPQFQSFNDGQWGDLEEWIAGRKPDSNPDHFIRGWADIYEQVWVVVGPLFEADPDPLPADIPVPSAFFCIVIDEENGSPRALAFLMPHEDERRKSLVPFLTSVDEIEERAGFDFFSTLPDDIETEMERSRPTALWPLPVSPH